MGLRQSGWVRLGFRRLGANAGGGGGGAITLIQGSSSINIAGGSGPTTTVSVKGHGVTNAELAQAPANTLKGNNTGGTADEADLTVAQVTTLLGLGTAAFQNTTAFDAAGAAAAAQAASDPLGSAAAAQAASQPLDADLTAIAALSTTAYGRGLLTLADQAALQAANALGGDFNLYSTKATVALGTTNLFTYFDDFVMSAAGTTVPIGWVADAANYTVAMFNAGSTETGGIEYSTLSPIATSRCNLYFKAQLFDVGTKDFYVACKQKCTTALGTNQVWGMSVTDNSLVANSFAMGFINALNPNNFVVAYGGSWLIGGVTTAIDLGVPKDTAYHIWEIWTAGADLKCRLDGGATFTAAGAVTAWGATKIAAFLTVMSNGAAGAAMGRETSWVLARGVR